MRTLRQHISGKKAGAAACAATVILASTVLWGDQLTIIPAWQMFDRTDRLDPTLLFSQPIHYSLGDGIVLSMVRVTPGEFDMGSRSAGERGSGSDEGPVHRVTITSGFEMSQFEVTREAFGKVMSRRELGRPSDWPVTSVDFEDCRLFCNRLSERFGFDKCYGGLRENIACDFSANGFRLPTEAEWEYACRAGTTSIHHTGDETFGDCERGDPAYLECAAWFKNSSNGRVHSVGELAPNAFGLFDTHGNVWEWCWDFYDEYCYASTQVADPCGPDKGTHRVVRGGCYMSYKENCRSATRGRLWPGKPDPTVGFRVVRTTGE